MREWVASEKATEWADATVSLQEVSGQTDGWRKCLQV
jgi:hypothetical protein